MTCYDDQVKRLLFLAPLIVFAACNSSSTSGTTQPPPSDDTSDAGPTGPLALAVGDVAELSVSGGVAGGAIATTGAEQFVVVIASTKLDSSGGTFNWSVDTSAAPDGAQAKAVTGCSISADAFKSMQVPMETPPTPNTTAKVGDTKTFKLSLPLGQAEDITAQVIAVGKHAIVWGDTTAAHPAVLDMGFVTDFLSTFDDTILPREREVFGIESDLDGDGMIQLVFTPETYKTAVAFFSGCDLANWTGCSANNKGEYLWLTPPNAISPPYNTPNAIKEVLAHETSHLVHFNRKILRNKRTDWPDSGYMIEGLGGFAQDDIGPQAGNLYVAMAGLDGIAQFSLADVLVDYTPYDLSRDGVLRGGGYLFARWLYDRAGGDVMDATSGAIAGSGGIAFLRSVLDVSDSVAATLPTVTKSQPADLAVDFYTTLAMSNRAENGGKNPTNACFQYNPVVTDPITKTPHGADVYEKFHGMMMNGPAIATEKKGTVLSGGVAYTSLSSTADATELDLTVKVDAKSAPRVRVGRIK